MVAILQFCERYGLVPVLLFSFQLLAPDMSSKADLMDRDLAGYTESISGNDIFKQLFWVSCALVYGVCLLSRGLSRVSKQLFFLIVCLVLVLVITTISLSWTAFFSFTLKRIIFQIIFVFVIFSSVYFSLSRATFSKNICVVISVSIVMGLMALGLSGWDPVRGFSGWAATKNAFGGYILALILLILFSYSIRLDSRRPLLNFEIISMFILFFFLVLSISKTAIMLGVLVMVSYCLNKSILKTLTACIMVLLIGLFVIAPGLSVTLGDEWNVAVLMDDETLTGRGGIWRVLYADLMVNDRFSTGYGYGAYFGVGQIPEYIDDPWSYIRYLNSAHNSYVELMLQLGWLPTLVVLCILFAAVFRVDSKCAYLCLLTVGIHSITESSILRDAHVMWVVYISAIAFGFYESNSESEKAIIDEIS